MNREEDLSEEQEALLEHADQLVARLVRYEFLELREHLAYLMAGRFTEKDLHMMLRGQILAREVGPKPCQGQHDLTQEELDEPEDEDPRYLWRTRSYYPLRTRPQPELDQAVSHPAWLVCPFMERVQRGERHVPCYAARLTSKVETAFRLGKRVEPDPKGEAGVVPCVTVLEFAKLWLKRQFLSPAPEAAPKGPRRLPVVTDQPVSPPLAERDAVLAWAQRHMKEAEELGLAQLMYLVSLERIDYWVLEELLDRQVLATEGGWLPCRHDFLRNVRVSPWAAYRDVNPGTLPGVRLRCPLELRARLGDRTVPCCEALGMATDAEMIAEEEAYRKDLEEYRDRLKRLPAEEREKMPHRFDSLNRVKAIEDLPVTWQRPEEQPGGPEDPVRLMKLRPCQLLGRLLFTGLYQAMREEKRRPLGPEPPGLEISEEEPWVDGEQGA